MSLASLSTDPKKNCGPKAIHSAGRIDAGFRSLSGLKFTLAEVLLYVAFALFVLKFGLVVVILLNFILILRRISQNSTKTIQIQSKEDL